MKTDYGNWVSDSMLKFLGGMTLGLLLCAAGSAVWRAPLWASALLGLGGAVFLCGLAYFYICHRLFAYGGRAGVQERIVDYVTGRLGWEEGFEGQLLDIGCGSGALSIRAALRYPGARVTGIDFWGPGWNYKESQCRANAQAMGVERRIHFEKQDAGRMDFEDNSFDGAVSNFVFHEVRSQPDKRQVVREALRVVKPGGRFVFHDLFLEEKLYGDIEEFAEELRREGISQVRFVRSLEELSIPPILKSRFMLGRIGLLEGVK